MTRPRALTSTFRTVIALFTALLVSFVGATALSAAAFAGDGQAKSQQANRPDNPGKAHAYGKAKQSGTTHTTGQGQSNAKAQSHGSSGAAKPAPAQKTQSTHGSSAQAHEGTASHGESSSNDATSKSTGSSKPAGSSSSKGDPKGNNGTIKLAGFDAPNGPGHSSGEGSTPMHPSNDPHLPCGFAVEGFGFDAVASQSQLTFEQHAPTSGGSAQYDSLPLDGDSHSGGGSTAGYDGVTYPELTFVGSPHPKHGYHVKLTATTDYSQGSSVKHKVFWVEPCETSTPPGETPGGDTPGGDTPGGDTPGGDTPGGDTPGGDTPGGDTPGGVQQTVDDNGGSTSTVVFGAQASVHPSQQAAAQASQQAAGAQAAEVPTAVESGLTGEEWSRSVLPLLAVLLGLGTTFVALVRRRTRVQPVRRD
jgi:hypothetical protein